MKYKKLRTRMFECGITQKTLAAVTGKCATTINQWLTGKADIRRGDVPVLARALGIPAQEIPEYFMPEIYEEEKTHDRV